jgi:hypothetical protein
MAGITGGDVVGVFAGEILQRQVSTNPAITQIIRLEAIYEVQAGDHSFTALIRGGQTGDTDTALGAALLDGVSSSVARCSLVVVVAAPQLRPRTPPRLWRFWRESSDAIRRLPQGSPDVEKALAALLKKYNQRIVGPPLGDREKR